jgi:hypothetical protein
LAAGFTFKIVPKIDENRYEIGDIVTVYPTSQIRTNPDPSSKLGIVEVSDASVEDLEQLRERMEDAQGRMQSPSIWNVSPVFLPAQAQSDLSARKRCVITWEQLIDAVFRKGAVPVTARNHGVVKRG